MSASNAGSSRPPVKPPVVQPGTGNNIIVNPCQRLNPILEHIRNVGKEFGEIVPDFQVGRTTCVLFLSLKYHRLHPEYIHQRIERLGHSYNLRLLLLMCDVSEHQDPIRELTKMCLVNNITIVVTWTPEEAGMYLSTYKQFEHRPPDLIKERVDKDYMSVLRSALTSITKVNKTDVETLRTSVGSFADIARATSDQLQDLPGFGQVKVRRMKEAFEKPFRNNATSIVPYTTSQSTQSTSQQDRSDTAPAKASQKGKEKAIPPSQLGRDPSPIWDIELDLNISPSPPAEAGPLTDARQEESATPGPSDSQRRKRPPSPIWDIELDLNPEESQENESGEESGRSDKRRKVDAGFGAPTGILSL